MSSMRNAVQRRSHRERAQPLERAKWGLLEKHKDYSLRAKNYGEKRARLKILQQKAADRNPDEFHYGMLSSRSNKGRMLADRGNPSLSQNVVKLLKTQDIGYLQHVLQKTRRAIRRLEYKLLNVDDKGVDVLGIPRRAGRGKHLVFIDDKDMQRHYDNRLAANCGMNQPRTSTEGESHEDAKTVEEEFAQPRSDQKINHDALAAREEQMSRRRHRKGQKSQETKLATLKARERELRDAEDELQSHRAKMSNIVGGVTKRGLKWKLRERKT